MNCSARGGVRAVLSYGAEVGFIDAEMIPGDVEDQENEDRKEESAAGPRRGF